MKPTFRPAEDRMAEAIAEVDALLLSLGPEPLTGTTMNRLAEHLAQHPPRPIVVALLVRRVRELESTAARSANASRAAKSKNAYLRAWVQSQWAERADREQSKASFVRDLRTRNGRKLSNVTDKTLAEIWLKGH